MNRSPGLMRLLIAPPAAGKTEWCHKHRGRIGTVLSLDDARARLGQHAHDQAASPAAVAEVRLAMAEELLSRGEVTLDATSTVAAHPRQLARPRHPLSGETDRAGLPGPAEAGPHSQRRAGTPRPTRRADQDVARGRLAHRRPALRRGFRRSNRAAPARRRRTSAVAPGCLPRRRHPVRARQP
jgi:hypothetical protein